MDIEAVKTLMTAFKEAELTSLSLKCETFELELGKAQQQVIVTGTERKEQEMQACAQNTEVHAVQNDQIEDKKQNQKMITSPMVGTFYAATDPKAKPLVEAGSKVKKGDVVCIIEAMKLMNEVEAEVEGEVVEVLVANEEMVEYNQPLFILK